MEFVTALVPMKGSSERVKGKNLRTFLEKPLCCYILQSLQDAKNINKIIVNTDSEEITEIAKSFSKVVIHERIPELQGHHIPMNDIIYWDIMNDSDNTEHYLQTHSTNPLLKPETIDKAVNTYYSMLNQYNSLFAVTLFQSRLYDENMKGVNHDPAVLINTQNLPKLYEENSNMYIFSKNSFVEANKNRIGNKPQMFVMDKIEALDIDTEDDFLITQAAYKALRI